MYTIADRMQETDKSVPLFLKVWERSRRIDGKIKIFNITPEAIIWDADFLRYVVLLVTLKNWCGKGKDTEGLARKYLSPMFLLPVGKFVPVALKTAREYAGSINGEFTRQPKD